MYRLALLAALAACSSKPAMTNPDPATPPPAPPPAVGSGSDMAAGSGSDMAPPAQGSDMAPGAQGSGSTAGDKAASGPKLGDKCGPNDACGEGTCVTYYGIAGPRGPAFKSCEIKCAGNTPCPAGKSCVTVADGPGQVCR